MDANTVLAQRDHLLRRAGRIRVGYAPSQAFGDFRARFGSDGIEGGRQSQHLRHGVTVHFGQRFVDENETRTLGDGDTDAHLVLRLQQFFEQGCFGV